jgi:hypothetical protein
VQLRAITSRVENGPTSHLVAMGPAWTTSQGLQATLVPWSFANKKFCKQNVAKNEELGVVECTRVWCVVYEKDRTQEGQKLCMTSRSSSASCPSEWFWSPHRFKKCRNRNRACACAQVAMSHPPCLTLGNREQEGKEVGVFLQVHEYIVATLSTITRGGGDRCHRDAPVPSVYKSPFKRTLGALPSRVTGGKGGRGGLWASWFCLSFDNLF